MHEITDRVKKHIVHNKKILLAYILFGIVVYLFSYLVLANDNDPIEYFAALLFAIFIPGLITSLTFFKENIYDMKTNKDFFLTIGINIAIPLLISIVFSSITDLIQPPLYIDQTITYAHLPSLPIIFISLVVLLEIKTTQRFEPIRIVIDVLVLISYLILSVLMGNLSESLRDSTPTTILNILYLYCLPVLLIATYYRKKILR